MKRILVLNNYSIRKVQSEVEQNLKPSHHLYGIFQLQKWGHEIITIDPDHNHLLFRLSKVLQKLPFTYLGNLQQQWHACLAYQKFDIVYAPCQDTTLLLGLLSYFKIFKKPIIALAHHPILRGRLGRIRKYSLFFSISGHTAFPALNRMVSQELNTVARKNISKLLNWGPDLNFYTLHNAKVIPWKERKYDLVSIGRTGRDYGVLVEAFKNTKYKIGIWASASVLKTHSISGNYENIELNHLSAEESLTYPEIIQIYSQAKVIGIPLYNSGGLLGLTSLTDAMAMGLPCIITHNSYLNPDASQLRIGKQVRVSEANDWFETLEDLLTHDEKYTMAVQRLQHLAEHEYNIVLFSKEMEKLITHSFSS